MVRLEWTEILRLFKKIIIMEMFQGQFGVRLM